MELVKRLYNSVVSFLNGNYTIYYIAFLALALRVQNFGSCSIWTDEGFTLELIHKSFLEIFKTKDVNAPIYPVIIKFWTYFFGYSLLSVRFVSVICSILTIFIVFKTTDKHFGRRAALISSLLLCFSNIHIYYSEEARCYSMLVLFAALTLYYFLELLKSLTTKDILLYILFSLLALYTQMFIALQLFFQGIMLLFYYRKEWRAIKKMIYTHLLIVVIFALWFVPTFLYKTSLNISDSWIPPISKDNVLSFFRDLFNTDLNFYVIIATVILVMLLSFVLKSERFKNKASILQMFGLASLPFAVICAVSYFVLPIFYPRYVMFVSIPLVICIGQCLSTVSWNYIGKTILVVLLCLMIYDTRLGAFRNQEWGKSADLEAAFRTDSCYTVITPLYDINCYTYCNMRWKYDFAYKYLQWHQEQEHVVSLYDSVQFLEKKLDAYERIIFYDGQPLHDHSMITYLKNNYDSVYAHEFYGVYFSIFDKRKIVADSSTAK